MCAFYANQDPTFQPARRLISSITKGATTEITTTFDHDYVTGTVVRINIPKDYGMYQLDNFTGEITVTGTDTFTIKLDSNKFDDFVSPIPTSGDICAEVIPIGETLETLAAATQNVS